MTAINWDISELEGSKKRKARELRVKRVVFSAALTSILISMLIIGSLLFEAEQFIVNVDLSRLWDLGWFPRRDFFDLKTLIVATLWVTLIAMIAAALRFTKRLD